MYITRCCQTDHTGMTGRPDAYANLPKLSRVLQLSLNGTGDAQERGHVPSSCFSSSVQRRLQFLALLQPHSCTFISFSTFIYLFSNSRIDEKQGCAFTERERAGLLRGDVFGQLLPIEGAPVDDWTLSDELCSVCTVARK